MDYKFIELAGAVDVFWELCGRNRTSCGQWSPPDVAILMRFITILPRRPTGRVA